MIIIKQHDRKLIQGEIMELTYNTDVKAVPSETDLTLSSGIQFSILGNQQNWQTDCEVLY